MEDSNSLDLTDTTENGVHAPFVFTRDHADWLTMDGQACFARGTGDSVAQSQNEAYAALTMKDTLSSPFGLDSARPTLGLTDVRAQPSKKDEGYAALETEGELPDTTAIIQTLISHRDLIMNNHMIYLIVDNRTPAAVPYWPAFAAWWASRRCLVGPQDERTDILWICADATTGLHKVPYYWAGVFVLEAARFLYPAQHFALIDNDCVPVTLFEVQDLLQLAHQQHRWADLIGHARSESSPSAGIGMLLFTEAHLEYNAGLVVSIGNRNKHSPLEHDTSAQTLAKSLQAGRLALVSRARSPVNPSDTVMSGTLFTPFVGIAMQSALDLCMVWSLYGLYMCKHFWPMPIPSPEDSSPGSPIKWPRQSHPRALTPEGRERTPWVTSWARATFEQGLLSVLPMLTGPCTVASLPGEHLFQASALPRNRMRPAIFHAFGKAKIGAQTALRELEQQGWETLPMAILGMPNLPPAWTVETWKPVGGCKFTGYSSGVTGNSALRFCLLVKWRAIRKQATELFPEQRQVDSLSCLPAEDGDAEVESVSTPSSDNSAKRADRPTKAIEGDSKQDSQAPDSRSCTPCPQQLSPSLFVPWSQVAKLRGIVAVHKDIEASPYEQLRAALAQPKCLVPGEKERFLQANHDLLCHLRGSFMPLEGIAPQVFEAISHHQQDEFVWVTVLWMVAQLNGYWMGRNFPPLPSVFQINCGGLGGGALEGEVPPHFHCMCPPVGESQVYGPSLSPADVLKDQEWGVAYGWSTGVHEVATLFALIQNPCQKWEDLGYGKAAIIYQRTQLVLKAARLLPAHRRLPHQAFLSGLWWKLLSLQPLRLLAYLPGLGCLRPDVQEDPIHFTVNGFSAGSYTGAVIALAIRCLWPASQTTARLGAIAMPKSVFAALVATAEPDKRNYYLVHAAEDCLCDWKPTEEEFGMLQQSLRITYVTESARWMGKQKHSYWHWLQCQLPAGQVSLTTLKLTHPEVVPRRDRIAAPMRLASWIRFETVMTSDDWEGAISLLVSNLHRSDQELLVLLQRCVAGQQIDSMEEAHALLLKNFRVGRGNQSASGSTTQHCPQAASFAVALGTAARHDNGHIVSMAASLALALRSGRSTLAVAGVFGAGKTRSLTFLLAWLALTTHLKIAVVHKENPAGRAITKLLTAFDLGPDHQRYFVRPVSREEAETNIACTDYDLRASDAASYIPGCHVVIVATGLVWDQKGQTHSTLNTHMENVDLLISEEAQQDMDLKSAFAPAVPRQPFFRLLLGDPTQSPGGVADGQRAHRTLLLKAPLGLRAPTTWYMPHEIPGVCHMLLRHSRGFGLGDLEETAKVVGHRPLGSSWFRPEKVKATSPFACQLQSTYKDLSRVDLDLPEGLVVGLGYAATSPDSPLDFRQAQTAAERSGVANPHCWSLMLPTSARVAQEVYEPLIGIQYPMLCSRMGDTWQIGTTSIREDHKIASGLRFIHWCHASPNVQAKQNPKNDPTVRVYQHIEDQLTRAGSEADDILALTTTREGATNLRNYFSIAGKKANAETAVKVAGATAKHCIVIHGDSTFLSGEGRNLDYDQECFTRANVAYSRATDLTILACPLNMQGMPGALQVLAALLHGVQTIHTYDSNKEPDIVGSLDLTVTQVEQATTFFQQALLPHPMWCGPLPVCLVEHHHGKVRRLRLVLATITHLTKAEINSLVEGPYLPGGTVLHDLVYGYAADASIEPEWLVITDGQQPGHWRLLHNSSGPGRRCSVGSSLRYQPTPSMREQRSAQDYAFEALHRVYFYDAWRAQPVLDAIGSDLTLPSRPGLLVHGCYWPQQSLPPDVLSVSDRDPDNEEHEAQEGRMPSSPAETDDAMAEEATQDVVLVHSSPSESPTIPSTEQPEDDDAHMEDTDSASSSSTEEGDCLSNRPVSPVARPEQEDRRAAGDDARSVIPPQNENHPSDSPGSHFSESPIKRRPGPKAHTGRAQPKKSRKSPASTSRQPLDSVPEHAQPPATLNDLASRSAQRQETPACRNPETPPDCPGSAQERPEAMTEIDIVSDQEQAERGGTAATDLQLESEQRAMQTLYDYQKAAGTTREAHGQKVPLPSIQIYSDLPREWPMARLAVSSKQINRLVRTFLWRRVTEQALHGSSFIDIPDEINQAYIGDLLLISEAFAAPLSNLFAFVRNGHPACPFIPQKQLALYANPRFWQYGLLAFIARRCSFDNQHRDQGTGAAQAREGKSQTTKEKDVDALTFMRTVIMSFVRGMEYGEQTLPTNDLFVYLPVQILPDLVTAMEQQGFKPAEVKGGSGFRPKEEGAEDNPLIVVGVHTKDSVYDRYPRMPNTSWAERAYSSGALDPSLGQAFAFPSLLQLRMRVEVPGWRDLATARNPTADPPAEEDSASDDTGSAERSPRLALPVPVGMAETQADETDEATEDEAMNAEPSYAFAKGYGSFGIGYTRLATALGNFEQGDNGAESAVVAQWLTSGLRIAMSRIGWNLISTRFSLTKVPSPVLSVYYRKGYPLTPKMADRPYNQYGTIHYSEEKWDQLCGWLTGNPTFRLQLVSHKQALRDHMGYSQETADPSNKARRTEAGSSTTAAGSSWHSKPPPPPSPSGWSYGWWQ